MRKILTITILSALSGCGLTTEVKQIFNLEMYGVYESPETATGDVTPTNQTYTLTGVSFTSEDGTEDSVLFADDTTTAVIANRTQIIYTKDIADFSGTTFSAATVTFEAAITGVSEKSSDHSVTLANPVLVHNSRFIVEEGKGLTLVIKVKWKNTVSDAVMSEPEFEMLFD